MALFTVCIDAGHGGKDDGIKRADLVEKDITLDLALQLEGSLRSDSDIRVVMTRTTDHHRTLTERAQVANDSECDLYISIHVNGIPGRPEPYGSDMFYWPGNHEGKSVANTIAANMPQCFRTKRSHEVSHEHEWLQRARNVLKKQNATSVLVEVAMMTNEEDRYHLSDPWIRRRVVEAIRRGILYHKGLRSVS